MNRLLVGMKKNLIFWTILLTIFLSGCGNSSAKKVVDKYFSAVKSGDFDKAIECFSPAMQSQLEASKALADSLFNVDSGAIFNGLVGIVNPQEYADYEFKPVSETIIDDTHTGENMYGHKCFSLNCDITLKNCSINYTNTYGDTKHIKDVGNFSEFIFAE